VAQVLSNSFLWKQKNHDEDALEEKEVVLISSLRGKAVKRKM